MQSISRSLLSQETTYATGHPISLPGKPCSREGLARARASGCARGCGPLRVQCTKRPRVGILVTGSELRQPGETLAPARSTSPTAFSSQRRSSSEEPFSPARGRGGRRGRAGACDGARLARLRHAHHIGRCLGRPHDLVRETQAKLRVEEHFWGVAVGRGSRSRSVRGATISSSTFLGTGVGHRHLRAVRPPRGERAPRPARSAARASARHARDGRSGTLTGTSTCGRQLAARARA